MASMASSPEDAVPATMVVQLFIRNFRNCKCYVNSTNSDFCVRFFGNFHVGTFLHEKQLKNGSFESVFYPRSEKFVFYYS